ncbi:hypothetical protein ACU686_40455 [Yinghuangia aomiensis]
MTHRIEFGSEGLAHRLVLDGVDVSSGLRAATVHLRAGELAELVVEPIVVSLDTSNTVVTTVALPDKVRALLLALGWQPPATPRDLDRQGWLALEDDDEPSTGPYRWQPCLETAGMRYPIEAWFATEAECMAYITEHILGRGLLDPEAIPRSTSAGA